MVKGSFFGLLVMLGFTYFIWISYFGGTDILGVAGLWNGTINYLDLMEDDDITGLNETDACLNEYVEKQYSPEDAERLCEIRMRNY